MYMEKFYQEKFKYFYFEILPIIINYIFIVCKSSIFRFKNSSAYFSTMNYLVFFMLAIERAKDILIYLLFLKIKLLVNY